MIREVLKLQYGNLPVFTKFTNNIIKPLSQIALQVMLSQCSINNNITEITSIDLLILFIITHINIYKKEKTIINCIPEVWESLSELDFFDSSSIRLSL
jgi:hypothetical protein